MKRSIEEIVKDLSADIDPQYLKTRPKNGEQLTYIPWHLVAEMLDKFAPGWSVRVTRVESHPEVTDKNNSVGYLMVGVEITLVDDQGVEVKRENTGVEDLVGSGYGDAFSNAYSMAFRRAAAMFGVGRYIYNKGGGAAVGVASTVGSNGSAPRAAAASKAAVGRGSVRFGRDKGKPISSLDSSGLEWMLKAVGESIDDPTKASFRASNQSYYDELTGEAEQLRYRAAHVMDELGP